MILIVMNKKILIIFNINNSYKKIFLIKLYIITHLYWTSLLNIGQVLIKGIFTDLSAFLDEKYKKWTSFI